MTILCSRKHNNFQWRELSLQSRDCSHDDLFRDNVPFSPLTHRLISVTEGQDARESSAFDENLLGDLRLNNSSQEQHGINDILSHIWLK